MEFRILGPLYADAGLGNGPAVIYQPLLQSALAVLLLRANRPCPRSMLIDALWGGEPPGSPEAALRVCVSRLRRCLGDCAERLHSVGPPGGSSPGHRQQRGYMMLVRPGELDVDEFTDLAEQGQAELDTGNPAAAASYLVQALALWGDPPLPDLPASEVLKPAMARLRNHRQAVIDTLVDARLAAGEHNRVLGQLRAAVLANPGRERTCAQLMTACQALGMRKEALEVYQQARHATLEQQGAEPGQALAFLYRQILAEEMAAPSPAARVSGSKPARPRLGGPQAPAPPADFTGRSAEVAAVAACLSVSGMPVAVLTGGPGAGKSALACAAALQLRDKFPDGQLYVELGGLERPREPEDVLADLLQLLGVQAGSIPSAGSARAALYRALLVGRKVLLIADDAATAAQVRPLIPAVGGAAIMVTSRSRLTGIAGARVIEIGELPADDAFALLVSVAGPQRIAAEPGAARAVISACGGLPLALRLAGATLAARPGLTVERLARDLGSGRALSVLAAEDTSVRAAIEVSYRAVSSQARTAFRLAAAAIPGDIPRWALTELASGDSGVAGQLTAVGLVSPAAAEMAGARFLMHPLTRCYGRQSLPDGEPDDGPLLAALTAAWLHGADLAAVHVPALPFAAVPARLAPERQFPGELAAQLADAAGCWAWLDCEQANLLAVAARACTNGDHQTASALASRLLARQCVTGGSLASIETWRRVASAAAAAGDEAGEAGAGYFQAVALAADEHRVTAAAELLAQSAPRLERLGVTGAAAMAYGLLGSCANQTQRHAVALRACQHAMRLAVGEPHGDLIRCAARAVLGETLARMGVISIGTAYCQRAVAEAHALAEPAYAVFAVRALVAALLAGGRFSAAADMCATGIELTVSYGAENAAASFTQLLARADRGESSA